MKFTSRLILEEWLKQHMESFDWDNYHARCVFMRNYFEIPIPELTSTRYFGAYESMVNSVIGLDPGCDICKGKDYIEVSVSVGGYYSLVKDYNIPYCPKCGRNMKESEIDAW